MTKKTEYPHAVRYVNFLLYSLSKGDGTPMVLRKFDSLPKIAGADKGMEVPPLDHVINRLKFVAGLNPEPYAEPTRGTVSLTVGGKDCAVECLFDDCADCLCTLKMKG